MKVIVPHKEELYSCSVSETDARDGVVWSATSTYALNSLVRHNHVTYKSLADSNKGNEPDTSCSGLEARWQRISATMPYRMLDGAVETKTLAPEGEELVFQVNFDRATAFALMNLQGTSMHVTVTDTQEGVFYDEEVTIVNDISSFSPFAYCFDVIVGQESFIKTASPMPLMGTLDVTIRPGSSNGSSGVGMVVVGRDRTIGYTKYGAEVGTIDYSKKTVDDFGSTTLVRRSFAKTASLPLYLHPRNSDEVFGVLNDIRATPCVFQGTNDDQNYSALTIYGWLENWRMVYSEPNEMELSLEIQGLI